MVNQQRAISAIITELAQRCVDNGSSSEALVVLDFKMKLEPMYYREKTVESYGKRGISWHGAMVQYFTVCEDEGTSLKAQDNRLYFDYISDGDNKQDRESVVSMMKAVMLSLREDLPSIKAVTLQSGDAACYQNALVMLLLPCHSVTHGTQVTRFIHTETQDGKSVLDAHFARPMGVLKMRLKEGNNCVTPTQALIGLKSNGGLPNTVVEVVDHDRAALQRLVAAVAP